jgi:hypothetical protein
MTTYKLNTEVIVVFKKEEHILELKMELSDLIQKTEEDLYIELEQKYVPCNCITESQTFCECGGEFEDYEIVEIKLQGGNK